MAAFSTESRTYSWATDLHLDLAESQVILDWVESAKEEKSEALFICGDITEDGTTLERIVALQDEIARPLFFILGNHDFYGGSIREIRESISRGVCTHPQITYLTAEKEPISLGEGVVLIGDDGLADGRAGDFLSSSVKLRDYEEIAELSSLDKKQRLARLTEFGMAARERLRGKLHAACRQARHVILLLHAPPFVEASLYDNQSADANWAPHFTSHLIGELILEVLPHYPQTSLLVLAGHTHHSARFSPLSNVEVIVGGATYGRPSLQKPLVLTLP